MTTPSIPASRIPSADRTTAAIDQGPTDRVNQRMRAQEVQNLDRRVREFERQQARFEQERQRLADSHARSVKTTEEQLVRRQSQLEADQLRVKKLQAETETQAQEADERLRQAGVIEASASAGRRRGLMLFLLALPIAAGFIWYGWHSDQRQAQLERSLALLAGDTARLADELDDSSAARAEMLASLKSLKLEASGSSEALSRLQSQNTSFSAAAQTLTSKLEAEQADHGKTRKLLAAKVEADGLRLAKYEAARREAAVQSDRLASANEALAGSAQSLETMRQRLAEQEETAGVQQETIALQDEAMARLQTSVDAMEADLITLRNGEVDRQALVATQRAELQSRIAELENELADTRLSSAPQTETESAAANE